ncbi:hypothetical protein [Staphylococcus kloosii]|uniref:Uncharacterized protein n=1 Tax=Staphylococcus kloosii TaxID=29384 RepID=A0A151A6L3_9STAP|nr:hypothetical protein [Staphylococcus kloosii]KYH14875.1 hypothetical protein A0131_08815 [Staphylococcus kloosii]
MSKEVPAIFMQDPKTGENVYVVSHVDYVDGMPDDFENYDLDGLQDNVSTLNNGLGSVQSQINNLQSQISNMVTDTGWQNITLNTGITAYSTSWTPQYRFITILRCFFFIAQRCSQRINRCCNDRDIAK